MFHPPTPRPRVRSYATHALFFLPLSILTPVAVYFFTRVNGVNLHEALARGVAALTSGREGALFWILLALAELAMAWWIHPVELFWQSTECSFKRPEGLAVKAMWRLDRLGPFAMASSSAMMLALTILAMPERDQSQFFGIPFFYSVIESLSTGMMIGTLEWMVLENSLFPARRNLVACLPGMTLRRDSMYAKIFKIILVVVFFLVFQVFATSGAFYRQGASFVEPDPGRIRDFIAARRPFDEGALAHAMKDTLSVFYVRTAAFLFFVVQILLQVKFMIKKPISIIKDRLDALNSAGAQGREIVIVQNDEYAEVYRGLNTLIASQARDLDRAETRLDSITEKAADPIIVYGVDRIISLFNPAAERYFGYSEAEALGTSFSDLISIECEGGRKCGDVDAPYPDQICEGGGIMRFRGTSKSGSPLTFEAHASVSGEGETREYTVILRDVAAQAELERALREATRAAETANRMKSEFLATMSHELRTPLNAVLGFTQLLMGDKNLTDGQRDKIGTISRSGEHLLALINDILDISKIEAGKAELRETVFDLPRFVEDIREMFEVKTRKKGLTLYVEHAGDLPRYVEGDLGKLRQIVINLVGNAVKFTDEGGIGLTVGMDGNLMRFSVRDSGRGIPEDELDAIMKPFVQSSVTDNEGGTGLGLAISTRFVTMLGGTMEVRSELGKGSVFSFTARLKPSERPPELLAPSRVPVAVKSGHAVSVLVVDDKETNRLVLKEMLEGAGFVVEEAENGREAVARARTLVPAIVFMDIRMPVMDGYEAVAALKSDPGTASIKAFALTASAFRHDEEKIAASGFDGFLAKPFKRTALFSLIAERTDVEMAYEEDSGDLPAAPVDPGAVDYAAARAALSETELATLAEAAAINDFGAVENLAAALSGRGPALEGLAAVLAQGASAFDEAAVSRALASLSAGDGKGKA